MDLYLQKKKERELRDSLKKALFLPLPEASLFPITVLRYKKRLFIIHIETLKYSQIQAGACFKYRHTILSEAWDIYINV